jgi:hypothetical protein
VTAPPVRGPIVIDTDVYGAENETADRWLLSVPGKRKRSLQRDEGILDCHRRPVFGPRKVQSITWADVQLLVDKLAMTHAPSSSYRPSPTPAGAPCRRRRG